jgi:hypothetical protein
VAQRVRDQIEQAHSHGPVAAQHSIRCSTGWIAIIWGGPGVRRMCDRGRSVSLLFDRRLSPVQRLKSRGRALHSIDAKLGVFLADVIL